MNATIKIMGLGLGVTSLCIAGAPDTARVAQMTVQKCAGIQDGDLVLIEGGTRDQLLLEDIAVEVRKLGAHPLIAINSDRLTLRMIQDVPEKLDAQPRLLDLKLIEAIDAVISVDYSEKPDLLANISPERLARRATAEHDVYDKMLQRGVVGVHIGNDLYPTEARAKQFQIPRDQLERIFWGAIAANYDQIQSIGDRVRDTLASGKEVRITAPNGTDLTIQIANRPVFVSDGVVSEEDRYAKGPASQVWLPAGEVYVTPVPRTANGTFVADNFFYEGKLIEGLKLTFKDGALASMTSTKPADLAPLEKRYKAAPAPARDLFSAIDVGINPTIEVPQNSRLLTWMESGTISIGFGGNTWAGGDNDVAFAVFAQLPNGTLTIDGRKIIDQGKLLEK